jgi:hypothetical protein
MSPVSLGAHANFDDALPLEHIGCRYRIGSTHAKEISTP